MMTASKCMDMRMEKALCDFQAVISQCMAQCVTSHPMSPMPMNAPTMKSMNDLMMMMKCMDTSCMDAPMMKSMSDLQMMLTKCMAMGMESECRAAPDMVSDCTESRMKKALCDLQMMVPQCMSHCMDVKCSSCIGREMPVR